jgi:hypothetical protein
MKKKVDSTLLRGKVVKMISDNKIELDKLVPGEETALVNFLILEYLVTSKDCFKTALEVANILINPEYVKHLNMV